MEPTIMFPVGKDAAYIWLYKDLWWKITEDEKEKVRKMLKFGGKR